MDLLTTHQQKALNFSKHISLTANAGSGKTFVLSRRYLEIALSEKGSLRKIAAITFTEKAAGELYKKIADQVENRFNKSDSEDEKKILSRIRHQLVSANISTIHSFCIDVLRQFPVEAGLDANFQPIDELTSDELIELSVEEVIKESLSGNDFTDVTKYLVRFFRSRFNLALQLRRLIKNRKKVFDLQDNIYNRNETELAEFFHVTFIKTARGLIQINKNEFISALSLINDRVLSIKDSNDRALEIRKLLKRFEEEESVETIIGILHSIKDFGFTKGGEVRKTGYLTGESRVGITGEIRTAERYLSELSSFNMTENYKDIEQELARFGLNALTLFNQVVNKYDLKKRENGYLDYEDILIFTKKLLKIPDVKAELSRRFKYIMIDEYQDTNEIQYKIFLPILDDLRQGNLFVVGDEKQSIYMFRDADLEVFRITKEQISNASGKNYLLSLPDSFRMAPGICLFVNKVFRKLFSTPNGLFNEVEHTDLVCAKKDETESQIEVLIGAPEKSRGGNGLGEISEAELVANRIISLVNKNVNRKLSWKDIAVLVRKRKSFSSLEKIFIQKNIPFNIVGGKGFYQRQSIYDIYNYFSFLLDNRNHTALVGILRSPFFTIPDSAIYELSLKTGETLWEKLNGPDSTDEKIRKAAEILRTNIDLSSVYSASRMLRKILSESPYLSVLAQKASGAQETANIYKLIKLTIDFQSRGYNTLYDYVNFLRESIEKSEDEAQAAIADESDSVKVMTLHQAKGLEYPAVFLYNSHEVTLADKVRKGSIEIDKNFGLMTKVPLKNDYFGDYYSAPISNAFDFISLKKETAEIKRLFYVGITRAKNYLFISAPDMEKYKDGSFMSLLQESLNIDFTDDSFTIRGELEFLKGDGDKHTNITEALEENIKIVRKMTESDLQPDESGEQAKAERKLIHRITDFPKGEIISASKYATFKQCPLKYQLTYDLGISVLIRDYINYNPGRNKADKTGFDFSYKENIAEEGIEETISLPAEIKGSIIHKILQKDSPGISQENIGKIIEQEKQIGKDQSIDLLQSEISVLLKNLWNSDIYKKIRSYKEYFNEYEIYLNEEDYFLHGILDKLIIEDKKAIIIDYKTDSIQTEEIFDRASLYFPQLKFYSYIVGRLFKELTSFELRIIFVNFPAEDVKEIVNRDEVIKYGEEIRAMIRSVRLKEFDRNLFHCKECKFALTNLKCIVERA